jgi:selenocysteine lyase/cysteine desulfurase
MKLAGVYTATITPFNADSSVDYDAVAALAERQIHVAPRLGRLRISPHVYNDEADVAAFLAAFRALA